MAKAKTVKKKATIPEKVINMLTKFGEQTTDRLAQRTGEDRSSVSSACSRLVRAGKIARTDGGTIGVEGTYSMPGAKKAAKKRGR